MVSRPREHASRSSDPSAADDSNRPAGDDADDDAAETREAVVGEALHGARLDRFLVTIAGEFSRSHLQLLVEAGHVAVEGRKVQQSSRRVAVGQRVAVELAPTEQSLAFRPEAIALDVRYEDEHVLIVDKPAGLVVHPAAGHWSGTLLNGLLARDAAAAALPRAGIVHRLDKDTSGLMVVARTLPAMTALVRAIAAREVQRVYLAIAHGAPTPGERFTVEAPIGRDPASRVRMAVVGGAKAARTDVEVVAVRAGHCALRCTLHTGRTHQIRVHLASRGLPLVADAVYGGAPALGLERQALHAWRLALRHPIEDTPLAFESAPPPDFATAWEAVAGAARALECEHSPADAGAAPKRRRTGPRSRAARRQPITGAP